MNVPFVTPCVLTTVSVLAFTQGTLAQGSLTPPGPPGPTMKTLAQIEPRTPISALPFVIQTPGAYYLTTNLTAAASSAGITIDADDVTLDLNGFALASQTNSVAGILVSNPHANVVVRNGTVKGWATGVDARAANNSRFESLRVYVNAGNGLAAGSGSIMETCQAYANKGIGISAGSNSQLKQCTAYGNQLQGISVDTESHVLSCASSSNQAGGINAGNNSQLNGCVALSNAGAGIFAGTDVQIINCKASNNGTLGISAGTDVTVSGCLASGNLDTGIGATDSAQVIDCKATANTRGIVVQAGSVVRGCSALQNGGDGIVVTSACTVSANTATGNFLARDAAGIHASGPDNCIKDNTLLSNDAGLLVDVAGNFIARNTAANNSLNYRILDPAQAMGPIVQTADIKDTTNPIANFSY